jgi:hypothetical protein
MSVINNIYEKPDDYTFKASHILVPFKRFCSITSDLYIPVSYINEEIENNYDFLLKDFEEEYYDIKSKQGEYSANRIPYLKEKRLDSYLVFINIEDLENTKKLIETALNILKTKDYINTWSHNFAVPRFYTKDTYWRCIYDTLVQYSSKVNFEGEINIYDPNNPEFGEKLAIVKKIIKDIVYNANGEIDDDILD